jgi:hypothetical protein
MTGHNLRFSCPHCDKLFKQKWVIILFRQLLCNFKLKFLIYLSHIDSTAVYIILLIDFENKFSISFAKANKTEFTSVYISR